MEFLNEHIDLLLQSPLAVIVLIFIYIHNQRMKEIIEGYQKFIEKLIDKLK